MAKSKKEIVSLVAAEVKNVSESQAKEIINKFLDVIVQELVSGEKITLQGFGVFEAPVKPARTRFNPLVQREIHTPARRVPKFTAAKPLREVLAEKK